LAPLCLRRLSCTGPTGVFLVRYPTDGEGLRPRGVIRRCAPQAGAHSIANVAAVHDRHVPIRHTRLGTISRVEAEYRSLDRVVRRLGSRLDRPIPGFGARARIERERWTGKDALAHIAAWKQHQLRTLRREKHDATLRGKPTDVQNRLLFGRWRRRTIREVVAHHRRVHRDVIAALRARPESYFADPPRLPRWPNDLLGHSAAHRERHLESLLDWSPPR
jgi:hypothetical protein